jgi:hypothetical protein
MADDPGPAAAALSDAERHVREGEVRVARQSAIVLRIEGLGQDARVAQTLLSHMQVALDEFYRDLWRLSQEVAGGSRWVHEPRSPVGAQEPADA